MKRINAILSFLRFIGDKFNIVKAENLVEDAIIIEETVLRK
jgi:hypothetical protein